MAVLYRKYRPQTFAEVLGQKHVVTTLKNQVKNGSVAHAYLFTGSRGVGKTSIARLLAKAVNCEHSKQGEPDGTCGVCEQIANGNFIDLVEIDAASNTGVDNIRDLIEHVKFSPSIGKYKVFIIDEVHMLSKGAFNALLKTLEEPPKHAIFVLATTEITKVPATIISRTQRFDFAAPSVAELADHLAKIAKSEKLKIDQEILELIASNAQGSTRDALSLLDKVISLGDNPSYEDCLRLLGVTDVALSESLLENIVNENSGEIPPFFDQLLEKGVDFAIFNKDFLEYLRKALIAKVTGKVEAGLSAEHAKHLQALIEKLQTQEIIFIVRLFLKSYKDLAGSPSPEIPLLLAALEAAGRKKNQNSSVPTKIASESFSKPKAVISSSSETQKAPVSEFAFTHVLEPSASAPKVEEPVFALEAVDNSVTWPEVEGQWPVVLTELKSVNSPLGNLVKNSPVIKLEDGKIYVGVKFLFHKQNLENGKNLKLICEIIEKVTGKRLGLAAQIVKEEAVEQPSSAAALGDALAVFGGELVE